jgi:hypothetical protein
MLTRVFFILHARPRVRLTHPAFPAPSVIEGRWLAELGSRFASRERRGASLRGAQATKQSRNLFAGATGLRSLSSGAHSRDPLASLAMTEERLRT